MGERLDITSFKSPGVLFIFGTVGSVLFILSLIIEVQIVLEYPAFGDVTSVVRTLWSLVLGIATLGSFSLALYNYRRDDNSRGPSTQFSVQGRNHDIDFHVHIGEPDESREPPQQNDDNEENDGELEQDSSTEDENIGASADHQREN